MTHCDKHYHKKYCRGKRGKRGCRGHPGATGADGRDGVTGPAGADGRDGVTGPAGAVGPTGPAGAVGPTGPAGADGRDGATGPAGADGATGPAGTDGATGPAGPTGPAGTDGGLLTINDVPGDVNGNIDLQSLASAFDILPDIPNNIIRFDLGLNISLTSGSLQFTLARSRDGVAATTPPSIEANGNTFGADGFLMEFTGVKLNRGIASSTLKNVAIIYVNANPVSNSTLQGNNLAMYSQTVPFGASFSPVFLNQSKTNTCPITYYINYNSISGGAIRQGEAFYPSNTTTQQPLDDVLTLFAAEQPFQALNEFRIAGFTLGPYRTVN